MKLAWDVDSKQGSKKTRSNEDGCFVSPTGTQAFLCDGHGGTECMEYFLARVGTQCSLGVQVTPKLLKDMNREFRFHSEDTGSTFTYVGLRDGALDVVALGDSSAIVVGKDVHDRVYYRPLTTPDSGQGEEKRAAIKRGAVIYDEDYIRGPNGGAKLNMTRALGDWDLHPYRSDDAHASREELYSTDTHVVVASDGLWDQMLPEDVADLVCLCEAGAGELVQAALDLWAQDGRHSDDTTVMIGSLER